MTNFSEQYFQNLIKGNLQGDFAPFLNNDIQEVEAYIKTILGRLKDNKNIKIQTDLDRFSWWQHSLQVIRCISNDEQSIENLTSNDLLRENNQSNQTIYQMAREMKLIDERFISIIETITRLFN